ncbi:MAG TPA: type I-U CRISPR-associated protein Csb2 [Gaiellaceae bacterium]|nr:type I-U CRISPR-associated protein Csb2 [Gaiellaceae bacterium]
MPLAIEVRFLLGSFAASDGHDLTPPEWPPAPARVFSALVAACEAEHSEALSWLERQGPPLIHAAEAEVGEPQPFWLVTNALGAGSARHPARGNVQRSRYRLHAQDPVVVYSWPDAAPTLPLVEALDDAAKRVHYLGRPISPVAVRVHQHLVHGEDAWAPGEDALETRRLRVPYPGYLAELEAAYEAGTRVDPPVYETYRRGSAEPAFPPPGETSSPWPHLLVLPLRTDAWIPGERALDVADALRSAILDLIGTDITPRVAGHGVPPPHAAYLAFPDVGHEHADGHLLAVGIALPPDPDAVRQVRRALDPHEAGSYAITLRNVRAFGALRFERVRGHSSRVPWGARRERWIGPATRWRTVLPAVLDRAPSRRLSEEEAVLETLSNLSLDAEVLRAEAHLGPIARGDLALRPSQTRRRPEDRIRPYRHLRVEFDRPVRGPLMIGALRHFGMGLCAPDET